MSVKFIGCPHLGHRNIATYRKFVNSCEDNTAFIKQCWMDEVRKKDVVYVMGDAAFNKESLDLIGELPGRKILIKGNHDTFVTTAQQSEVFEEIHGMIKYKGIWVTHCPIHPDELWNKPNVHAHVHYNSVQKNSINDPRYLNVCVDVIYPKYNKCFLDLDEVKQILL